MKITSVKVTQPCEEYSIIHENKRYFVRDYVDHVTGKVFDTEIMDEENNFVFDDELQKFLTEAVDFWRNERFGKT